MPINAKWTGFMVDIEATGPIPGDYSMFDIGAVRIDKKKSTIFRQKIHPIGLGWNEAALHSIGKTFIEISEDEENVRASLAMANFETWVKINTFKNTYPMFFSDNNGFDFMFTHWYFIHFLGKDPFGHTSRNIADLYRGQQGSFKANFKKLRKTRHSHNPVDDAMGNTEALIKIIDLGLEGMIID